MELLLIYLVAVVRPLAAMRYGEQFYELFAIGLFGVLMLSLIANSAVSKSLRLSLIDGLIVAFTIWGIATSCIYYEGVAIGEVAKLLIPLLSYIAAKNVIQNTGQYRRLLLWMIVGFSVPTLMSGALILAGDPDSIQQIRYWTSLARWQGVYSGAHSLGHSMTLFLITLALYVSIEGNGVRKPRVRLPTKVVFGFLAAVALYCLYMSAVRSALLGLLTFTVIFLYFNNRKALLAVTATLVVVASLTVPFWLPALLPEIDMRNRGIEVDDMSLGSGRPRIWLNDITVFYERPIDEQLAGAGIGNRYQEDSEVRGHNDWLEMLTQTGIVGFLLFAALQFAILRRILRMEGKDKWAFFALFAAVSLMMLVSNAYAWRIQVSQLYYMILAFIELPMSRSIKDNRVT
jgi:O-antigen ligase